jgi:hypothetical protein
MSVARRGDRVACREACPQPSRLRKGIDASLGNCVCHTHDRCRRRGRFRGRGSRNGPVELSVEVRLLSRRQRQRRWVDRMAFSPKDAGHDRSCPYADSPGRLHLSDHQTRRGQSRKARNAFLGPGVHRPRDPGPCYLRSKPRTATRATAIHRCGPLKTELFP